MLAEYMAKTLIAGETVMKRDIGFVGDPEAVSPADGDGEYGEVV